MRIFRLAALLIASLWFAQAQAADSIVVRLTFSSGWDAIPALVGIERGFFAENGLIVSGLAVDSTETLLKSVSIGTSDFVVVSQRAMLLAAVSNLPVKILSMNGWGTAMELVVPAQNQSIRSVADLKGKTIAMVPGSEAYPVLIRLLNAAKLKPGDVTVKYLRADQLTKVFVTHGADAVFETRKLTIALDQNGKGRVVVSSDDIAKTLGYIGAAALLANNDLIAKDPAKVQKFINGWVRALWYMQRTPDDAARIMVIFFHRQGVTVSTALAKAWVLDTRYDRYTWSQADIADAEYNAWGLQQGGLLKVPPKLAGFVDNHFAEQAAKALPK
jgi:ABC-type nitrate/sulfonate/bicarbonate transport system substrate-binding protein